MPLGIDFQRQILQDDDRVTGSDLDHQCAEIFDRHREAAVAPDRRQQIGRQRSLAAGGEYLAGEIGLVDG